MALTFVSYLRVSTEQQGAEGLGIDSQRSAVARHVAQHGQLVAEFVEVESGRKTHTRRPQLAAALALARSRGATLIVAKLDRLARNVAFIAHVMDSGAEFVALDNPHATRLTLHVLAAVAEDEATRIRERTRLALDARRRRGLALGHPATLRPVHAGRASGRVRRAARTAYVTNSPIAAIIRLGRQAGLAYRQIAEELTRAGLATTAGGTRTTWNAMTVLRMAKALSRTANDSQPTAA